MTDVEIERLVLDIETIAILVYTQISSNSFKNQITDKLNSYMLCISI